MNRNEESTPRHAAEKARDIVGGLVGKLMASMVSQGDSFVKQAAISDAYERSAARIALDRAKTETVKDMARRMLDDHTTSTHQLQSAMETNETRGVVRPEGELDERREKMLSHLESCPEDKFDQVYVEQQVLAHEEASSLMHGYAKRGDNSQLVSFALGTAPVIDRHLAAMKELRANMS